MFPVIEYCLVSTVQLKDKKCKTLFCHKLKFFHCQNFCFKCHEDSTFCQIIIGFWDVIYQHQSRTTTVEISSGVISADFDLCLVSANHAACTFFASSSAVFGTDFKFDTHIQLTYLPYPGDFFENVWNVVISLWLSRNFRWQRYCNNIVQTTFFRQSPIGFTSVGAEFPLKNCPKGCVSCTVIRSELLLTMWKLSAAINFADQKWTRTA